MPCLESEVRVPSRGVSVYARSRHMCTLGRQSFEEIKERCLSDGELFEDPQFPADASTLKATPSDVPIRWRRPTEICANPTWTSNGYSRFDVVQGELGDCWLLAAVASLTCNKHLLRRVVYPDQSFQHGYCGVFRFRLWYQGTWVDVVVDDRLPTLDLPTPRLLYMHSARHNEFWSALLEKAFAKVYGGYQFLHGGGAVESLEDLTGGLGEMIEYSQFPRQICNRIEHLLELMAKTLERGGLLTCAMNKQATSIVSVRGSHQGLLYDHAYSVTSVREVDLIDGSTLWMVRVRNPWGNGREWRGPWSDNSLEWRHVSPEVCAQLNLEFEEDGEFWMRFEDFFTHFTKLDVCNLDPLQMDNSGVYDSCWDTVSYHRTWIRFVNAGGSINNKETVWRNPQFLVTLTEADDNTSGLCTMIVALMQKDRRRAGLPYLGIGYVIYKLPEWYQQGVLHREFFRQPDVKAAAMVDTFLNTREVSGRHRLPPGNYVIIPSTFEPDQEANFLLRVFTERPQVSREMDAQTVLLERDLDGVDGVDEEVAALLSSLTARQNKEEEDWEEEEVDARRLSDILSSHFNKEFGLFACRSLVAMYDKDMTGCLPRKCCENLCQTLIEWQAVFNEFTEEVEDCVSSYSLRPMLQSLGFQVSNNTLRALVLQHMDSDGNIHNVNFIACLAKLSTLLESFKHLEAVELEKSLQAALYC